MVSCGGKCGLHQQVSKAAKLVKGSDDGGITGFLGLGLFGKPAPLLGPLLDLGCGLLGGQASADILTDDSASTFVLLN